MSLNALFLSFKSVVPKVGITTPSKRSRDLGGGKKKGGGEGAVRRQGAIGNNEKKYR